MDFHETWIEDESQPRIEPFKFVFVFFYFNIFLYLTSFNFLRNDLWILMTKKNKHLVKSAAPGFLFGSTSYCTHSLVLSVSVSGYNLMSIQMSKSFSVADQLGCNEIKTIYRIPFVYRTCNLEHSNTTFQPLTLSEISWERVKNAKTEIT